MFNSTLCLSMVYKEKLCEEAEDKKKEQNDEMSSLKEIMELKIKVGTVGCTPKLENCGSDNRLPPYPKLTLPLFDGLSISKYNYDEALKILTDSYGRSRVVISKLILQLINMPSVKDLKEKSIDELKR
ncbi:unnamed protein product [Lepeophtheirus salmonis]|nr:unnamed protein product [Lepeophtheirus salmonis]CAF2818457.1 unnamed protein product [Lepeophtheirus salmonis]